MINRTVLAPVSFLWYDFDKAFHFIFSPIKLSSGALVCEPHTPIYEVENIHRPSWETNKKSPLACNDGGMGRPGKRSRKWILREPVKINRLTFEASTRRIKMARVSGLVCMRGAGCGGATATIPGKSESITMRSHHRDRPPRKWDLEYSFIAYVLLRARNYVNWISNCQRSF